MQCNTTIMFTSLAVNPSIRKEKERRQATKQMYVHLHFDTKSAKNVGSTSTVYTNVLPNKVSPSRMHDFQTHSCFYTVTHRICSTLASHFIEFLMISNLIILSTILRALKRVSGPTFFLLQDYCCRYDKLKYA